MRLSTTALSCFLNFTPDRITVHKKQAEGCLQSVSISLTMAGASSSSYIPCDPTTLPYSACNWLKQEGKGVAAQCSTPTTISCLVSLMSTTHQHINLRAAGKKLPWQPLTATAVAPCLGRRGGHGGEGVQLRAGPGARDSSYVRSHAANLSLLLKRYSWQCRQNFGLHICNRRHPQCWHPR